MTDRAHERAAIWAGVERRRSERPARVVRDTDTAPERSQICGAWQQLLDAAKRVERMQRTVPTGHVLVDKEAFGELVNAITVLEELR